MKLSGLVIMLIASNVISADWPMIVAHRGASRAAPENTLPAFNLAWKQGAYAVEGDFRLTKDGHIACIHDADTQKVAGKKIVVANSTLEELRALDVGIKKGEAYRGTKIPTIQEVFATIPDGKSIYIEIKCGPEIIPALLKEIKASGLREEQILVISFKKDVLKQLKKQAPQLKISLLQSFGKKNDPSVDSLLKTLADVQANGLSTNVRIPEDFIPRIQKAGYRWHVWTVNDTNEARRMKDLGAASITTDIPDVLLGMGLDKKKN